MAQSSVDLPEEWDMAVVYNDQWPPRSISIIDENGAPVSFVGAQITMPIWNSRADKINGVAPVRTLTNSDFIIATYLATFNTLVSPLNIHAYYYEFKVLLVGKPAPRTQYAGAIKVS